MTTSKLPMAKTLIPVWLLLQLRPAHTHTLRAGYFQKADKSATSLSKLEWMNLVQQPYNMPTVKARQQGLLLLCTLISHDQINSQS